MKKITTLLLVNSLMFTCINGMENSNMDVELNNNSGKSHDKSRQSDKTNKYRTTDNLIEENNLLLRTLIVQNNIMFDRIRKMPTGGCLLNADHIRSEQQLDDLYRSTNAQIHDKSRHLPMIRASEK